MVVQGSSKGRATLEQGLSKGRSRVDQWVQ